MAITAFLASFLDHMGRRTAQHLWPDPEDDDDEEPEKDSKKDPEKEPEEKKT